MFISFFLISNLLAKDFLIGKSDRVDLPTFNLENIQAKIDTGAKTSSLHCSYIKKDGNSVVFEVLDKSYKEFKSIRYSMPIYRVAKVKSSNGVSENRFVIKTEMVIFNRSYDVEFTLRDRSSMSFPILLGREFLQKGFIVDVRKKELSYIQKGL